MQNTVLAKKIKTKDIKLSLQKYASQNAISIKQCDFSLLHIDTYMHSIADDDFQLYNSDIHQLYTNESKMRNQHIRLHQIYTINAKKLVNNILQLDYSVEFDEYNVHPKLIISPKSTIPYKTHKPKEILLLLLKEINKIKAKNNILVKIFDNTMNKNLKSFVSYLYAGKFKKKIKLSLFDGLNPTISRQSKLIMWYKEKNQNHQVIEVEAGELILEYKKGIFGQNGFNAFGEVIDSGYAQNRDDFEYDIDENSIEIVENKDKKMYKSKIKGFVHFSNNLLSIDNKVRMRNLSRIQTSVTENEDNNIEVHVAQHNTDEDSIGEGVKLQSEVVHITGHVGAKSVLEALDLRIDGATHKTSLQYAKDAVINRHKGTLRCNNAKINLLEGGTVHGSNVEIHTSLGGAVYAENVIINVVKSHLKVYASNSITIKLVTGEDNIFKISYKNVPVVMKKLHYLEQEVEELKYQLEGATKHTASEIPILKQKIKETRLKQDDIKNNVKKAQITIEKPLRGLNTIIFTLDSGDEVVYKTDPILYKPFYIEVNNYNLTLHPVHKTISLES
jgi:hypothetical protein